MKYLHCKLFRSQRQVTALVNELGLGPVSLRGKVSAPPPGQGELGKMFKKASEKNNQKENVSPQESDVNKVESKTKAEKKKNAVAEESKEEKPEGDDDKEEVYNAEEELSEDELKYIEDVEEFLSGTDLSLTPSPPTKGDGNCWYRAAAAQVLSQCSENRAGLY